MKTIRLIGVILAFALLAGSAAATTEKVLPSKESLVSFIQNVNVPAGSDYVETMSKAALNENENWPWDIWESQGTRFISFYYKVDSGKGYGSLYYYGPDKQISRFCRYNNIKLIESHPGDQNKDSEKGECKGSNCGDRKTIRQNKGLNENKDSTCTSGKCNLVSEEKEDDKQENTGYRSLYSNKEEDVDKEDNNEEKTCTSGKCNLISDEKEEMKKYNTGYRSLYSNDEKEDTKEEDVDKEEEKVTDAKSENEEYLNDDIDDMTNKQKIKSVIHYGKAAGFDDDELQVLEMCLTFYLGY